MAKVTRTSNDSKIDPILERELEAAEKAGVVGAHQVVVLTTFTVTDDCRGELLQCGLREMSASIFHGNGLTTVAVRHLARAECVQFVQAPQLLSCE